MLGAVIVQHSFAINKTFEQILNNDCNVKVKKIDRDSKNMEKWRKNRNGKLIVQQRCTSTSTYMKIMLTRKKEIAFTIIII